MKNIILLVDQLNWGMVVILCLTLGLVPFSPPHIIEKLSMLIKGNLVKPLDWFDLLLHGFPWIILLIKTAAFLMKKI
jgi:hypothetical protein